MNCTMGECRKEAEWRLHPDADWFDDDGDYDAFLDVSPKFCRDCVEFVTDHEMTDAVMWVSLK